MSFVCLFLLSAFSAVVIGHDHIEMRWCIMSKEKTKCNAFKTALETNVSEALNRTINVTCVEASDAVACMKKIEDGKADLITLDGGEIYIAGKDHKMVPVVGEDYGEAYGTSYYATAVIRKNNSDEGFDMDDLEGKKSCHTGAGKTAGWNVPVGFLLSEKYMKRTTGCNPYKWAGDFFDKSCVPDNELPKFNPDGDNPANLCELCEGNCTSKGRFSNYHGAFKCMAEGVGDVAFVKHTTVKEVVAVEPAKYGKEDDYLYLCRDGGRKEIGEHLVCNLAIVPSHAVMTKEGNHVEDYKQVLIKASELFGVNQTDSSKFQIFNSTKYNGGNLLFKDSTKELVDVGDKNTYEKWLGEEYKSSIEAVNECAPEPPSSGTEAFTPLPMVIFLHLCVFARATGTI